MKNNLIKGSLLIALGASSYGMLATFVKMAYHEHYTTAEVTISQFTLGVLSLLLLNLFSKKQPAEQLPESRWKSIGKLMLAGTSMGGTSVCYYLSVQYIPVSVGIVLLMQTVWMGVILEMILKRKLPGARKFIAMLIILTGTILATKLLGESVQLNWKGLAWGLGAAASYTISVYATHGISIHMPVFRRSLWLIAGGLVFILCIFHNAVNADFSFSIFTRWGIILSLFGTVLPPLLFTKGMPLTGVGLGAIIAAVEIPVSVMMAHVLLKEPVNGLQWLGIAMILAAVVMMNIGKSRNVSPAT